MAVFGNGGRGTEERYRGGSGHVGLSILVARYVGASARHRIITIMRCGDKVSTLYEALYRIKCDFAPKFHRGYAPVILN